MAEDQIGEIFKQNRRRKQLQSSSNKYTGRDPNHNYNERTLEHGKIHSLLQNFGFIYCANRPMDIFFHFSEVKNVHPVDLNIDDEVEFYVGPRVQRYRGGNRNAEDEEEEKLSAFSINVLEPGTVQWDTPDDPPNVRRRGMIHRVIKGISKDKDRSFGYSNKSNKPSHRKVVEGLIVVESEKDKNVARLESNEGLQDATNTSNKDNSQKMIIRYTTTDYDGEADNEERANQNQRYPSYSGTYTLSKQDLVEFTLVTEKRSGLKFARSITLIQSEHERLEEELEKKRLECATLEQGIIATLKDGFGFLRSNKRKQQVYFQYSNVCLPDGRHGQEDEYVLAEGQDMQFLVVTESDGRISARQVNFLEKGSVVFRQILATGATGVVVSCPHPHTSIPSSLNTRNKQSGFQPDKDWDVGTIRLDKEILFIPTETKDSTDEESVTNVTLLHNHSPGGLISLRKDGSRVGLWIREGDHLLFDVYREYGESYASPTKWLRSGNIDDEKYLSKQARIRLTAPSLTDRAEGVVTAVKDSFGFIRRVESNDDVYFRLTDIFPLDLQRELLRNARITSGDDDGDESIDELPRLEVGSEVSFDLSLLPTQGSKDGSRGGGRSKKGGSGSYNKEQLRAQRITILPKYTLNLQLPTSQDRKGIIIKSDQNKSSGQSKTIERNSLEQPGDYKKNISQGIILSTVSSKTVVFSSTPTSNNDKGQKRNNEGGRWDNCVKEGKVKKVHTNIEGQILLLGTTNQSNPDPEHKYISDDENREKKSEKEESSNTQDSKCSDTIVLLYSNSCLCRQKTNNGDTLLPKRGDLVSFCRDRTGKPRDIRMLERDAGTTIKGSLRLPIHQSGNAIFYTSDASNKEYNIKLSEVLLCETNDLKENEPVEGILHDDGNIYGVCRSSDIHLESKLGSKLKERPKLNITVKKELKDLGGKIIAQSNQAKGPDGTNGFLMGWTQRKNLFEHLIKKDEKIFATNDEDIATDAKIPSDKEGNRDEIVSQEEKVN